MRGWRREPHTEAEFRRATELTIAIPALMLRFPNAGDRESPGVTGTQAAWTCPSCQRTVPARVDTCYCGTDRETADRFRARELGARRGGPSWSAIGLALAAAVVVALGFLGSDAPLEPEPTPTVVAPPKPSALVQERTPPTTRPRGRRWRDPEPPVPTPVLTSIPTGAPEPIEEPSPEPTPEPTPDEHSMDVRRVEGRGDFEAALSALEPEVLIVNRKLRIYRDGCRTSTDLVQPGGCGVLEVEIRQLLDDIDRSVAAAEEEARRSWVQPGTQRDILRKHELDPAHRGRMRSEIESALR